MALSRGQRRAMARQKAADERRHAAALAEQIARDEACASSRRDALGRIAGVAQAPPAPKKPRRIELLVSPTVRRIQRFGAGAGALDPDYYDDAARAYREVWATMTRDEILARQTEG